MERVSLTIAGMSCGHCVRAVEQVLKGLPGVQIERVDVGSAIVSYDPASVTPELIREAVSEEGYEIRSMEKAA